MFKKLVRSLHGRNSLASQLSLPRAQRGPQRRPLHSLETLEGRLALAGWSVQDAELQPTGFPEFGSGDNIGRSVAIYGDTAVVGVPDDDGNEGSIYIFKRTGNDWAASQRISPADLTANDQFGFSVAISGNTIVVGAPQNNKANSSTSGFYIFERTDGASPFAAVGAKRTLTGGDTTLFFGRSVAIDGNTIVAGAPWDSATQAEGGSISIYKRDTLTGLWPTTGTKRFSSDLAVGDSFGETVAISGGRIVAGAPFANHSTLNDPGAAYVFVDNGVSFVQEGKLISTDPAAGDRLGTSVAIDGTTAVAGAPNKASNAGAAYVFDKPGATWTQSQKLTRPGAVASDLFGTSVAIEDTLAAVGAPGVDFAISNSGAVLVYEHNGSSFVFDEELHMPTEAAAVGDSELGRSVSINNASILVGAPEHAHAGPTNNDLGAAYVFVDINDEPFFTAGSDIPVLEDSGAYSQANWATGISAGAANESGQALQFIVTGNTDPALFAVQPAISNSGTLTFTPAANAFGTASITVVLMDDGGTANGGDDTSDPVTFEIDITGVNDAPSFVVAASHTSDEDDGGQAVAGFAASISAGPNEAGQVLTFEIIGNDNPGLFATLPAIAADGTLTYTAAADASGTATIAVRLKDDGLTANGGVDTSAAQVFTINVNAVNDPPANSVPGAQSVNEDDVLVFASANGNAITLSDIDAGAANIEVTLAATNGVLSLGSTAGLTFSVGTGAGDATMTFQGTVAAINAALEGTTFDSDADYFGPASVTIITDDLGNTGLGSAFTAQDTIDISVDPVNDAPTMASAADHTSNEDGGPQSVSGFATASAGPANEAGQSITYSMTGNTNSGLFAVLPSIAPDGTLTYTAAADANGSATITVQAQDDGGTANGGVDTSAPTSFTITINAVNDAPTMVTAASHTSNEDNGPQSVSGFATASPGPADESGQAITYSVTGNTNPGMFAVAPSIAPDGTLTYTAAANAYGTATITVQAQDNGGTANGGVDTSAATSFTITVNAVNDAPTFVIAANHTSNEDAGAQSVSGFASAISAGPANESGQTVTFAVTGNTNPALFLAPPSISPSGTLTYTAAANAKGSATITVKLSDNGGTANGGVNESATQTFTITVNPVNDAPVANGQTVSVTQDGQTTIVLGGSDLETATANLTFTITSLPASGILTYAGSPVEVGDTFVGPPSLVYTPAAGSSATTAAFNFTVTDRGDPDNAPGDAAKTSTPATVTINITPAVANGAVTLSGGIVRVGGTNSGDSISVEKSGSSLRVTLNGNVTNFPLASVTEVRVWGRDGSDIIAVDSNVSVKTMLDGGDGMDMIDGGNGADLIFGGAGIDFLFGNGGNDMVIGGDDADIVVGGSGHDVLVAGRVAPQYSIAMLRDIANAWAANRVDDGGPNDGTIDESVVDTGLDLLAGEGGADWFIINLGDLVIDYQPNGANGDVITYT